LFLKNKKIKFYKFKKIKIKKIFFFSTKRTKKKIVIFFFFFFLIKKQIKLKIENFIKIKK